jgi:Flp pilus assembly pilin Flp
MRVRKRVYAFTVNLDVDLFTIMFLIGNCAPRSILDKGAIDMLNKFRRFLKDESGAAAVAIIPLVTGVGHKVTTIFTTIQTAL